MADEEDRLLRSGDGSEAQRVIESPVDVIARSLREAATLGALPAHREPLLFRSVAMIAVQSLDANGYSITRKPL